MTTPTIKEFEQGMRDIYEVWAGSEGIIPATAPEAYQQRLIKEMVEIAKKYIERRMI